MAYLPGLAMRRIADLYPGRAKTDARDAFIIAAFAALSDPASRAHYNRKRARPTTLPSSA